MIFIINFKTQKYINLKSKQQYYLYLYRNVKYVNNAVIRYKPSINWLLRTESIFVEVNQ
jgi:hypothetical protein